MIVGAGRAGKTALTKSILGEDFSPHLESTIGIHEFTCDVKAIGLSTNGDDWGIYCEKGNLLGMEIAKRMKINPKEQGEPKSRPIPNQTTTRSGFPRLEYLSLLLTNHSPLEKRLFQRKRLIKK